ncbi:uncharacterized protein LOC124453726 [Xenia sp. Carnegie-2017]|uniref:uncharacterized protein LOC124453726 n=1 Tax=Xenia sp. Carnegie-2017 TaxID=2897299 RepID=UPI001F040EDC|nr:uncharacterized protein LOC124453726 [Xenia sp. Carnegie-2017]
MTKSEMNWEDNVDSTYASDLARRFAIEDLAMQYRTSLTKAEKILSSGMKDEEKMAWETPQDPSEENAENQTSGRTCNFSNDINYWPNEMEDDNEIDVETVEVELEQTAHLHSRKRYFQDCHLVPSTQKFHNLSTVPNHSSTLFKNSYVNHWYPSHTHPYNVTYTPSISYTSSSRNNGYSPHNYSFIHDQVRSNVLRSKEEAKRNYRFHNYDNTKNLIANNEESRQYTRNGKRWQILPMPGISQENTIPQEFVAYCDTQQEFVTSNEKSQAVVPPEESLRSLTFKEEKQQARKLTEERPQIFYLEQKRRQYARDDPEATLHPVLDFYQQLVAFILQNLVVIAMTL